MKSTLLAAFFLLNFNLILAQDAMYVTPDNGLNLLEGPGTGYKIMANNGRTIHASSLRKPASAHAITF